MAFQCFVLLALVVNIFTMSSAAHVQCTNNEEYSSCIQEVCRPQNCRDRYNLPEECPTVAKDSCQKGCVCEEGYFRGKAGNCISTEECDGEVTECGDNETTDKDRPVSLDLATDCDDHGYFYCPTHKKECTDVVLQCDDPSPSQYKTRVSKSDLCCQCKNLQHRRSSNGTCIPVQDYPPFDCSDEPNKEYHPCPQHFRAQCGSRVPQDYLRGSLCLPKCICKEGYYSIGDGPCKRC